MNYRRAADRVSLPLIVVFVLTLLAFLPLAIPGRGVKSSPVQGYSTPDYHRLDPAPPPVPVDRP